MSEERCQQITQEIKDRMSAEELRKQREVEPEKVLLSQPQPLEAKEQELEKLRLALREKQEKQEKKRKEREQEDVEKRRKKDDADAEQARKEEEDQKMKALEEEKVNLEKMLAASSPVASDNSSKAPTTPPLLPDNPKRVGAVAEVPVEVKEGKAGHNLSLQPQLQMNKELDGE